MTWKVPFVFFIKKKDKNRCQILDPYKCYSCVVAVVVAPNLIYLCVQGINTCHTNIRTRERIAHEVQAFK